MMIGGQCGDQLSALKDCGDDELSPELYSDKVRASQLNCSKYGLRLLCACFNDLKHSQKQQACRVPSLMLLQPTPQWVPISCRHVTQHQVSTRSFVRSLTIQHTLIMMHIDDEHTSLMEPEERPGEQMGDENVVGFVFYKIGDHMLAKLIDFNSHLR